MNMFFLFALDCRIPMDWSVPYALAEAVLQTGQILLKSLKVSKTARQTTMTTVGRETTMPKKKTMR